MKSGLIILPDDVNNVEGLRKQLLQSVTPPEVRRFEELRAQGLDSETAADLSGMDAAYPMLGAEARLSYAQRQGADIAHPVVYETARSAAYEIPSALRSVGSTAGAAAGSILGLSGVRFVAQNARYFGMGAAIVGIGIGTVVTGKIVAAAFGKAVAGLAIANIISAAGIIAAAVLTRK